MLRSKEEVSKQVKQKLNYAKNKWPEAIEKYETQEKILNGRNSYSKTDTDATFMRMKEDHMKNGQLKAAYNVQLSTADQYIVDYSLHPNPTDTATFKKHIEQHYQNYHQYPQTITADAGYGSEENLQYLEDSSIEGYVKYASFDKEQSAKPNNKKSFAAENLYYNEQKDCYYCPMGQTMHCTGSYKKITSTGFEQTIKKYQAQNCNGCPLRGVCHSSKHNRIIEVNHNLNRHKAKAKANLNTEEGIKKRKKRFMLRSKKKVLIEVGLLSLAQNIRKRAA